jgi:hypothetical protein
VMREPDAMVRAIEEALRRRALAAHRAGPQVRVEIPLEPEIAQEEVLWMDPSAIQK